MATLLPVAFPESVRCQRSYHFLQDYFEMSFLEVISFPASLDSGGAEKSAAYLDTIRHIGTRLTGTTDMIAEALLASGELAKSRQTYESLQPVLRDLFRRNLAAEVMVGLYLVAAAIDASPQPAASVLAEKARLRDQSYIDPKHDVRQTIDLGKGLNPAWLLLPYRLDQSNIFKILNVKKDSV